MHHKRLLVLAGVVIVVVAGALVAYHFISDHNKPAGVKNSTKNSEPVPVTSKPQGADANSVLTLNELGVKMKLPDGLKELTYTVTKAPGPHGDLITVQFIMPGYSQLANKCAGLSGNTAHPFANLSRAAKGQPKASIMKQLDSYDIVNSGSSVPPKTTCKDPAVAGQLKELGSQLTASLKSVFQTAKPL